MYKYSYTNRVYVVKSSSFEKILFKEETKHIADDQSKLSKTPVVVMLGLLKKSDKPQAVANTSRGGSSMEGILKRKNRHGEWKERYCKFTATQFVAYKTAKGKATTELKECYELRDIEGAELIGKDQLQVSLYSGDKSLFKGSNLEDWQEAIRTLIKLANQQYQASLARDGGTGKNVHISGYLLKKSHNKYQGFQERFVKLEGTVLKYYKKEGDGQDLGNVDLMTAEFIRPFSDAEDCKIFEVADKEDRVFTFQASSYKEMLHWITTLNSVRNASTEKAQADEVARVEAETPERIRFFDNEGEAAFKEVMIEQVTEMYPDPATLEMTVRMHVQYATEVVGYMKDIIPEIQAEGSRPARYDILAVVMTVTNQVLGDRFASFLAPTSSGDTPRESEDGSSRQALSDVLDSASLGDLHMLINWISKYQTTLRGIRCPVQTATSSSTSQAKLSSTHTNPKQCEIFGFMKRVCQVYVYGGSTGAKGGAAEHLADHCEKVWKSVASNPEEMLQRHNNGTFFTEAPINMWVAINQHMSLAMSTNSPILHVMMAEKVVTSLIKIFDHIITYVITLDTSQRPELREIELEYISGLANDTALHIEDVIELIENFTIAEIRDKIDEIFDPLTTTLFQCGQACLKRLAGLVMSDVQGLLDQVFEEEWMEGNQMRVATATISDYMRDIQQFLVPFWADKFVMTILEEVILSYTRTLLFRKDKKKSVTTTITTEDPNSNNNSGSAKKGLFSSFFQKTKQTIAQNITQTITTQVPSHVPVDAESLGRLAQDVNILNAFFSLKAEQEVATEFLQLINEVSLLLFVDVQGIIQHVALRVNEYPSAAAAIHEIAQRVMMLRYEDFAKSDRDYVAQQLASVLQAAPAQAMQHEQEGIVEGRLGLLFIEVIPKDKSALGNQKLSLAQRMKVMANIPMFGGAKHVNMQGADGRSQSCDDGDYGDNNTNSNNNNPKTQLLLDDVLTVLTSQKEDLLEEDNAYAQEQAAREAEAALRKAKVLFYDGYLEKKSPAHNLWQRRFYKFTTREQIDNERQPYFYTLLWYKKEGGSLIKGLEVDKIASVAVVQTTRALAYLPPPRSQLLLMSEVNANAALQKSGAVPVHEFEHEENSAVGLVGSPASGSSRLQVVSTAEQFTTILITQTDGKEHVLRGAKVDRVMKWVNIIATAGGLAYDASKRKWTRTAMQHFQRQLEAQQQQLQQQQQQQVEAKQLIKAAKQLDGSNGVALSSSPAARVSIVQMKDVLSQLQAEVEVPVSSSRSFDQDNEEGEGVEEEDDDGEGDVGGSRGSGKRRDDEGEEEGDDSSAGDSMDQDSEDEGFDNEDDYSPGKASQSLRTSSVDSNHNNLSGHNSSALLVKPRGSSVSSNNSSSARPPSIEVTSAAAPVAAPVQPQVSPKQQTRRPPLVSSSAVPPSIVITSPSTSAPPVVPPSPSSKGSEISSAAITPESTLSANKPPTPTNATSSVPVTNPPVHSIGNSMSNSKGSGDVSNPIQQLRSRPRGVSTDNPIFHSATNSNSASTNNSHAVEHATAALATVSLKEGSSASVDAPAPHAESSPASVPSASASASPGLAHHAVAASNSPVATLLRAKKSVRKMAPPPPPAEDHPDNNINNNNDSSSTGEGH